MNTIKKMLDEVKKAINVESDYALAKALDINKARISAYYAGKEVPNEIACLRIAKALGKDYAEISAAVRIEAEKDEKRREEWRKYYKSIGGIAAAIMLFVLAAVTFIVTVPSVAAKETMTYASSIPSNTNYATFRRKIRAAILAVRHMLSSALPHFGFSG